MHTYIPKVSKQMNNQKINKEVICQSCGSKADKQSDFIMNGRDDLFSCPVCKNRWMEVSEDSLPLQIEKVKKITYTFSDNTDYKIPATNLTKTALTRIIKRMGNIHNWGNLYSCHIQNSEGQNYEITTTEKGKPNGFTERS